MIGFSCMLADYESQTLSNFCLDAAKIVFGSLVIGVFAPGTEQKLPWATFVAGLSLTIIFLGLASKLLKKDKKNL